MTNPYILIMALSGVIIVSFFFNILSKKTNIPSVLLLIGLGMGIKQALKIFGLSDENLGLGTVVEGLATVGLVLIVLGSALDLKLAIENTSLILRALFVAILGLVLSMFALGGFFLYIFPSTDFYTALVYAIPLSMMTGSVIIPRVGRLTGTKKEFMVYESTFSDIFGILLFYFMIGAEGGVGKDSLAQEITINIAATVVLPIVAAFLLNFLFHYLSKHVKMFLILCVVLLLFAVGKFFHLSSLPIILIFGLVLSNPQLFFRGRFARSFDRARVAPILHDFHTLKLESTFLIRTFFFVLFGLSIALSSLFDVKVILNSLVIVGVIYAIRFLLLRFISRKNLFPEVLLVPRGLITVVLFFLLLKESNMKIEAFDAGFLVYPMLITCIVMMIALITQRGEKIKDVLMPKMPHMNEEEVVGFDPEVSEK